MVRSTVAKLDSGAGAHARRWLAHGLAALAAGGDNSSESDVSALQSAMEALAAPANASSAERAELYLHAGVSARRRGDFQQALELHQVCAEILRANHWLGELGRTLIERELSLDRLALTPGAGDRTAWSREPQHAKS